jgi:hypothetical protein
MYLKKSLIILLFVIFLAWISWLINSKSFWGIDDANIYFVYMRNLANGHGFVYNVGGEKVEGFTSLLWVLIGATFYLFTPNPQILLLSVNILLLTASIYFAINWLDKNHPKFTTRSLLLLGLIAVTPGFIDWTILSLLETGLWSFLLTVTGITIISEHEKKYTFRRYSLLAILFTLLLLCRPEAMLWVPVFIGMDAYRNWRMGNPIKKVITHSLPLWAVFFAVLSALTIWRLNYFGYPLPNTYYAKVSNNRLDNILAGIAYLEKAFLSKPFIFLIAVYCIYKISVNTINGVRMNTSFLLLNMVMAVTFLIPLYSGGDHFGHQRFIIPTLPFIFIILILSIEDRLIGNKSLVVLILSFVFLSSAYSIKDLMLSHLEGSTNIDWTGDSGWKVIWHKPMDSPLKPEWDIVYRGKEQAVTLNDFFSGMKMPSQGVFMAGALAYFYKGETIDLLGLSNVKMAHAKKEKNRWVLKNHGSFDNTTFYTLSPDLFWLGPSAFIDSGISYKEAIKLDSTSFGIGFCHNMQQEQKFRDRYGFYRISKQNFPKDLQIFSRRSFIKKLDSSIYKVREMTYE